MRCARVEHFVDAMADSHDLLFLGELLFEPWVDTVFATDFLEHVDDAFIGAAMEGAFEGSDGRGDRGEHVAERCDGDARAEGAGVHAVVGVEHVGDVEGLRGLRGGLCAVDEVEEVSGFGEVLTHGREIFSLPKTMEVRCDHPDFRGDVDCAMIVRFGTVLRVVQAEEGDSGPDDVHR